MTAAGLINGKRQRQCTRELPQESQYLRISDRTESVVTSGFVVRISLTAKPMEPTDEQLIASCRDGNQEAWEILVRRYRRLIYAIPRRAGFDEDAAGDVFQQVFSILVKNIDRIKQPSQIHAWLVTTTRRETIRLIRSRKEARLRTGGDGDETLDEVATIPDDSPLADEVLLGLEIQNRVRIAVDSLDERCRRLIEMLFYRTSSPSYFEIATELGISEGSIGPTRARCLQKTMTKLDGK